MGLKIGTEQDWAYMVDNKTYFDTYSHDKEMEVKRLRIDLSYAKGANLPQDVIEKYKSLIKYFERKINDT